MPPLCDSYVITRCTECRGAPQAHQQVKYHLGDVHGRSGNEQDLLRERRQEFRLAARGHSDGHNSERGTVRDSCCARALRQSYCLFPYRGAWPKKLERDDANASMTWEVDRSRDLDSLLWQRQGNLARKRKDGNESGERQREGNEHECE